MGKYEFNCPKCNKRFIAEKPQKGVCPDCKVEGVRIYSVGLIQFKGKGFYATGG
jgi:putative FmdB family regulatory protein